MKIVLTGASGYLGQLLIGHFMRRGDEVVVVSRHAPPLPTGVRFVAWDGKEQGEWSRELDGADAVINLAGRTVNCRYNAENRRQILESRLQTTRAITVALQAAARPPRAWLNSSSATIYRDARDRAMDESTGEIGSGFSVEVCQAWEAALFAETLPGTRRVAMRLSMVFGQSAPVFQVFARLTKLGLGGAQGRGDQYVSWLHERDFLGAVDFLLEHEELSGAVNVCGPNPLTNREFMKAVRRAYGARFGLPGPRLGLEVGALLMGTETELILKSRRVVPRRLLEAGFQFEFERWPDAVSEVVQSQRRQ